MVWAYIGSAGTATFEVYQRQTLIKMLEGKRVDTRGKVWDPAEHDLPGNTPITLSLYNWYSLNVIGVLPGRLSRSWCVKRWGTSCCCE